MIRARLCVPVLILAAALLTSCASGRIVSLPEEVQKNVTAACNKADEFVAKYREYRPKVIENREWVEELFPGLWGTLEDFDRNAEHYKAVVDIVCRLFSGDPAAQRELDAKRAELQSKGLDWNAIITGALKIAPLFL